MNIKTLIIIVSLLGTGTVFANQPNHSHNLKFSNYTDYFSTSGGQVSNLVGQSNVRVESVDATHFNLHDKNTQDPSSGTAALDVSADGTTTNSCHLVIADGADMMNPIVQNISCQGTLQYTGMQHSFGSYSYELDFTQKS